MGSNWGFRLAPVHLLGLTLALSLAALTALLGAALFHSELPSHRTVIDISEIIQLWLVVLWGVFLAKGPRLFPALNSYRAETDWTTDATGVQLWVALAFEVVALVAAVWAAVALLLFTQFGHGPGDAVIADWVGIEETLLLSGPTGVVALWIAIITYLCGFVFR